jgi:hypothetical protein
LCFATRNIDPGQSPSKECLARFARENTQHGDLGLECLQIDYDVCDLIGIKPELRHRRVGGHDSLGQATAQAFDRKFLMKSAKRGRDCERARAGFIDGMALRAMSAYEGQTSLRGWRLRES